MHVYEQSMIYITHCAEFLQTILGTHAIGRYAKLLCIHQYFNVYVHYVSQNGWSAADIAEEMGYTEISALFQKRRSSQTTVRHIFI